MWQTVCGEKTIFNCLYATVTSPNNLISSFVGLQPSIVAVTHLKSFQTNRSVLSRVTLSFVRVKLLANFCCLFFTCLGGASKLPNLLRRTVSVSDSQSRRETLSLCVSKKRGHSDGRCLTYLIPLCMVISVYPPLNHVFKVFLWHKSREWISIPFCSYISAWQFYALTVRIRAEFWREAGSYDIN